MTLEEMNRGVWMVGPSGALESNHFSFGPVKGVREILPLDAGDEIKQMDPTGQTISAGVCQTDIFDVDELIASGAVAWRTPDATPEP